MQLLFKILLFIIVGYLIDLITIQWIKDVLNITYVAVSIVFLIKIAKAEYIRRKPNNNKKAD